MNQGRDNKQMEDNYKSAFFSIMGLFISMVVMLLNAHL